MLGAIGPDRAALVSSGNTALPPVGSSASAWHALSGFNAVEHAVVSEGVRMPIEVGAEAPDFVLKNQNNQEVRLSDFRGSKNVLLVFYPLAFTGTCQGELCQLRDNLNDFVNDDVQVLTVSVDSIYSHKVWADQEGYEFPLLADFWPHGAVAQAYGVFNEERGFANRGTFLIDQSGIVRFAELNQPGEARDQNAWRKALADLTA
jgi:peroxiredoxin (alkyl hydroperoxide reductase subunit C)